MKNIVYFFIIDETIIVDEDEFELDIVPVLNDIVDEIKKEESFVYIIKESPFQKRFYWKLIDLLDFGFPNAWIVDMKQYQEHKEDGIKRTKAELNVLKYIEYIGDVEDSNRYGYIYKK